MPAEQVTFTFDGSPVRARRGQTVAAALLAAGVLSWRTTRSGGRPRGLFCGIGACFDCLVDVGEDRAVRACLVPARDGDDVRTSTSRGPAGSAAAEPAGESSGEAGRT